MAITYLTYITSLAEEIHDRALNDVRSIEDWRSRRDCLRARYLESMGIDWVPSGTRPEFTDRGRERGRGFTATRLSYEIVPDCHSGGLLFLPEPCPKSPVPGVLYLCGHANFGVHEFHPHGIMWARRGYACFVVDTIRQTDNPGEHLGLTYHDRWDWLSLGYSPAGGELLNSRRALDVLAAQPEVDAERIGATGISGGGAHSVFVAMADDRVRAVASFCGVSNLSRTIASRCFESHCECMMVPNPYRHDTSEYVALIAPRPLLLGYAEGDDLFTPGEYETLHRDVARVYALYGDAHRCELMVYPGPHAYSDDAIRRTNAWFDTHVAGKPMDGAGGRVTLGGPELSKQQCTVFAGAIPVPDRLDILPEILTPPVSLPLPNTLDELDGLRERVIAMLRARVFSGVDAATDSLRIEHTERWSLGEGGAVAETRATRASIGDLELWIEHRIPAGGATDVIVQIWAPTIGVPRELPGAPVNGDTFESIRIEPRVSGRTAIAPPAAKMSARAALLVGVSTPALWVEDALAVMAWLRRSGDLEGKRVLIHGRGEAGIVALYAALFDGKIDAVVASDLIVSHKSGAYLPGVLKVADVKHVLGLIAPRIVGIETTEWIFGYWATRVYERLGVRERFVHTHSPARTFDEVLRLMRTGEAEGIT